MLWSAFAAQAEFLAAPVEVRVLNKLTAAPVAGARVVVRERAVEEFAGGELSLLPWEHSAHLAEGETDKRGRFAAALDRSAVLGLETEADGYHPRADLLQAFDPLFPRVIEVTLVPVRLTPAEQELLDAIEQRERMTQAQEEQWIVPHSQPREIRAFATTVPDQVRVENLNGFTGLMNFDEFIAGVVSRELGDSFPSEALKAQAVASRSFALEQHNRLGRANGGQAYTSSVGSLSRAAALATTKTIMTYGGNVIRAYFSARCNGDFTLNSEEGPTLANCRVGGLGAGVVPFARARPCSGHVNCRQTSEACCIIEVRGKTNAIYGHGVGMCQRGAQQFASRDGLKWGEILHRFYTGIEIQGPTPPAVETLPALAADLSPTNAIIRGRVVSDGGLPVVDWRFDWGASTPLDQVVFKSGIVVDGSGFSARLEGLAPGQTYHYRAWARNGSAQTVAGLPAGWGTGGVLSFQTPPLNPVAPTLLIRPLQAQAIVLRLEGAPGADYAVEASPDLLEWVVETRLIAPASGIVEVELDAAPQKRFFRARIME